MPAIVPVRESYGVTLEFLNSRQLLSKVIGIVKDIASGALDSLLCAANPGGEPFGKCRLSHTVTLSR